MKNKIRVLIVLAILLVAFSVISFALPFEHTATFWLSYVFGMVAIAVQAYVLYSAFMKGNGTKSKFYGFPIATVGAIYLAAQLVLSLIMMALAGVAATWIAILLYVLLLVVASIGFIAVDAVRDEVVRQEVQIKKDISLIRGLQAKVNGFVNLCGADVREDVANLAEALRYSDPVSNETLAAIEAELSAAVEELRAVVATGDSSAIREACSKTNTILMARNQACKLSK